MNVPSDDQNAAPGVVSDTSLIPQDCVSMPQPTPLRVTAFWHVWLTNRWRPVISEQLLLMRCAGLTDYLEVVWTSVIGEEAERRRFYDLIKPFPRVRICAETRDPLRYEFPAIEALHIWALSAEPSNVALYFHTKGISYPDDRYARWRDILNNSTFLEWRKHITMLRKGADVSGQNYLSAPRFAPHFSGNFWYARPEYVATLPSPLFCNQRNRYEAEQWLCSIPHRPHSLPFIEPNP